MIASDITDIDQLELLRNLARIEDIAKRTKDELLAGGIITSIQVDIWRSNLKERCEQIAMCCDTILDIAR